MPGMLVGQVLHSMPLIRKNNAVVAKTVDGGNLLSARGTSDQPRPQLTVKKVSEGKGGSRKARGKLSTDQPGDDVDDIPLSGLVQSQASAVQQRLLAAASSALPYQEPRMEQMMEKSLKIMRSKREARLNKISFPQLASL